MVCSEWLKTITFVGGNRNSTPLILSYNAVAMWNNQV